MHSVTGDGALYVSADAESQRWNIEEIDEGKVLTLEDVAKIVDTELNSSEEKIEAKTPNTEIQKGGTRPSQSKNQGR